ncbi:hypothetical protein Tco_1381625 [Tanacetum coccineum]
MVHLSPPATQEESNALNNAIALERAWFSLARGALAQTDILERFEHLQANFNKLVEVHAGCEDTALRIKELEDTLAKKDSALVYAERINTKRAPKKEKLQSLSEPFNLAIQVGWGKGLAEERSEGDVSELMGRIEGFDAYADTKMKVYPASPSLEQAPPNKPSSGKASSTIAPRES